jgi:hypothetical protein
MSKTNAKGKTAKEKLKKIPGSKRAEEGIR